LTGTDSPTRASQALHSNAGNDSQWPPTAGAGGIPRPYATDEILCFNPLPALGPGDTQMHDGNRIIRIKVSATHLSRDIGVAIGSPNEGGWELVAASLYPSDHDKKTPRPNTYGRPAAPFLPESLPRVSEACAHWGTWLAWRKAASTGTYGRWRSGTATPNRNGGKPKPGRPG